MRAFFTIEASRRRNGGSASLSSLRCTTDRFAPAESRSSVSAESTPSRGKRLELALSDTTVYLNGKFAAQPLTGVQRVGHELVLALDQVLSVVRPTVHRWVLMCPPQARPLKLQHIAQDSCPRQPLPLHLWEQAMLPWVTRRGLLVNLAGTGPWLAPAQVVLHHDAAVFDHPQAYTTAFAAWYRRLFARQARTARRCMVVSAFSRDRLAACLDLPARRWQVMPLGADHLLRVAADDSILARMGLRRGGYLLVVGSANPTKNLAALLAAHARLCAPCPPLVLVGGHNGRVFANEVAAAEAPGLLRAGRLDDAALRALYEGALALVFPSVYEGFGLPPLEAMALGCPVLTTRCASLPEVCGDAALYADAPDAPALAMALQRLLADAGLRDRLRAAGLAHTARCTWARAARQLHATIEEARAPV
jgi:glycosyltransferase involved in cell wall biosynthesis